MPLADMIALRSRGRIISVGVPVMMAFVTASCAVPPPGPGSRPPGSPHGPAAGAGAPGAASGPGGRGPGGSPSGRYPSSPDRPPEGTQPSPQAVLVVGDDNWTDSTNPRAIPLGDGKVSTVPRAGYVDSCTSSFRGGGAQHSGPWISTSRGTWDEKAKLAVQGHHRWPAASYHVSVHGSTRVITTNDLPVGMPTGTFPVSFTDPAYQYDHNPNSVAARTISLDLPADPSRAASPSCTGLGPTGVTADGVLLFNALDAAGRDAGAHEIQDGCHGHPNGQDMYHYHSISGCLEHARPNGSELVGYALDGYGIYAEWNSRGKLPTDAELGACHGRTSTVLWNGAKRSMFHYDVTLEYPYTVGCYRGTPVRPRS